MSMKDIFSRFKKSATSKITNLKNRARNGALRFQKNFDQAKKNPKSKRKSLAKKYFLGFTTVLGIFGVTLLAPILSAVAKDVPNTSPKPGEVCPNPTKQPATLPSQQIIGGLSGAAATICGLAISSGSFLVGAACGVVVVVGILKAQGK